MTEFSSVNASFLSWLTTNGATVSNHIALQDYSTEGAGRGVVASVDLPKDHELFSIPRSLLLNPETSPLSQKLDLTSLKGWNPLMMCLIYEYCQGPASTWKPYFDILPEEFSTPMFWSEDDLKELAGTGVIDKIGKEEAEAIFNDTLWPLIRSHPDLFPTTQQTDLQSYFLRTFHRMGSLIMAYAFHAEDDDDDEDEDEDEDEEGEEEQEPKVNVSMVPMADMLNHKTGHNNARLFHEKDCLRMVAIKSIKQGQQIYNTYGDLCNADLLRKYGFVDMPNPFSIAEISGESLVEKCCPLTEDAESKEKEEKDAKVEFLLDNDGLEDQFILEAAANGEIPEELIGCAKILLMPFDEFNKTVVEGKKLPSTKLTLEVQKVLRELLESRLAMYPGDSKEDRLFLKQAPDSVPRNKRNAIIVRSGEREILQSVLDKVKKWRPPPPPPSSSTGKHKGNGKGAPPNKGKKPYQKK
ncbi:hypothetical protein BG004_006310 [Podila humilis]|nr:hypothetical protein BG004_006310 [Podila humilis]